MVPAYKPRQLFDAQLVYKTWMTLVAEEPLYEAMQKGQHEAVARRLGMSDEQVLILDDFADQAGTRWHVENLRFRCATMVARSLKRCLPGTIQLLTRGSMDWLSDLAYEYMSHSRWQDFGHHRRGAECQRFAEFVRERIMKRRPLPEHFDAVLHYELTLLDLVQRAGRLPESAFGRTAKLDEPLGALRVSHSATATIVELPLDIVSWLERPEGELRIDGRDPVGLLFFVPSAVAMPTSLRLDAVKRRLLQSCDGARTVAEIVEHAPDDEALIRDWVERGILRAAV